MPKFVIIIAISIMVGGCASPQNINNAFEALSDSDEATGGYHRKPDGSVHYFWKTCKGEMCEPSEE